MNDQTIQIIQGMTDEEYQVYLDSVVAVAYAAQPWPNGEEFVVEVMEEEAQKFVVGKKVESDRERIRGKIQADMAGRQRGPVSPIPPSAEDASTQLERVIKRLMSEDSSLDYSSALNLAQRERKDLAARVLEQLNAYRHRNDPESSF